MCRNRSLRIGAPALALALLTIALAACGASAESGGARGAPSARALAAASAPPAACGAKGAEVLATAAGTVATRIYAGERAGSETRSDQHQVESFAPLLSAIAAGGREAIAAAVTTLVYSHTHIVRLRITRGASVLADVGGPYILAPVSGTLRLHGHVLAHYVLSVQDDLGYIKLVTRFLGVPIVLRARAQPIPVAGQLTPAPASIPALGRLSYRGSSYEAFSFAARSYSGGPLRISLLVPLPRGLAAESCAQIRSVELAHAAKLISRRFNLSPASFGTYIELVQTLTDGLLYVRAGRRTLAASTPAVPARLPSSGPLSYRGQSYYVSSFTVPSSLGHVRVYQLVRG